MDYAGSNDYIDLSIKENREAFIGLNTGEMPTGKMPIYYHHWITGEILEVGKHKPKPK